jgi:FKBP-type peptidyl-prolyl cis-trans isomerase FkpA
MRIAFLAAAANSILGAGPAVALVAAAGPVLAQATNAPSTAAATPQPSAVTTPSGLVYRAVREGTGVQPTAADTVKVNYRGTFLDGREFDSSYTRGQPATFPLGKVIPCWTEGVQRMKVGGKATLVCPAAIAYGERGAGNVIPPNATLQFEVELLEVVGR